MNPILPLDIYIPDAEPRVFGERVYLYGSHDIGGDSDYCSYEYYVYSASIHDLSYWTNHGISFASKGPDSQVPWSSEKLYAPDVVLKDDIYYLYFCLSDGTEGVATSLFPQGPFTNAKQMSYPSTIHSGKALEHIDPAAFVDDDGKTYYYWGQFNGQGAQLKENMYEIIPETYNENLVSEEEHYFHEGSSMRKIGNKYYFIFCDIRTGRANSLSYAIGDHPLGPFKYEGVIINNFDSDPQSWNNHGSIVEIKGQWYIFYHRSSHNSRYSRRACVEPIEIDDNGKISQTEMTTQGFDKPLNAYNRLSAVRACQLHGGNYLQSDNKGSHLLINNINESCAAYKFIDFGSINNYSKLRFESRILVLEDSGTIEIVLDNVSNPAVATIELTGKTSENWIDVSASMSLISGIHAVFLRFKCEKKDTSICKVNWFEFEKIN